MRKIILSFTVVAMLAMSSLAAVANPTREANCTTAGGTFSDDLCTVLGEVETVPVGDPQRDEGEVIDIGDPQRVDYAMDEEPTRVNALNARQAVFHHLATETWRQPTEVEVTITQQMQEVQEVTVWDFYPASNPQKGDTLRKVVDTDTVVVGPAEPEVTHDTIEGSREYDVRVIDHVINPGKGR
jgi:hypothetical protein